MKQIDNNRCTIIPWLLLALATGLVTTHSLAGEIYKWTDENGLVHFGDRPPQGQQAQSINTPEAAWPG